MNKILVSSVLVVLAATPGISQEETIALTPPEGEQTRHVTMKLFVRNSASENLAPYTRQERLSHYLRRTYGIGSTLGSAAVAGFQQWTDTPKEWQQGFEGYRKRFASVYGTRVVQRTIEYGASALLHEDNRYRRSLETGSWRRAKHAIKGAFSSTDEDGRRHFSYSRVGAAGATAFVRRTWQPSSRSGVGDAVGTFGMTLGAQVGANLLREFWPDLNRRLVKR